MEKRPYRHGRLSGLDRSTVRVSAVSPPAASAAPPHPPHAPAGTADTTAEIYTWPRYKTGLTTVEYLVKELL